jgi:hypothetical protein
MALEDGVLSEAVSYVGEEGREEGIISVFSDSEGEEGQFSFPAQISKYQERKHIQP